MEKCNNIGIEINNSYCIDAYDGLGKIFDDSVHLVVTSPPYDQIYDYDQLGFEEFEDIAHELNRVLVPGGVIVWIVDDQTISGSKTLTSFKQLLFFKEDVGMNIHDTQIYEKHNFSNPAHNRYHNIFEFMFILSKEGPPHTFNPIRDRKNICAGETCWGRNSYRQADGTMAERDKQVYTEFGMRHNIWRYKTGKGMSTKDDIAYKHPAIFPDLLAQDHIRTWTNRGDVVLDPFAGSGTVGKMAHLNSRDWILFEKSQDYHDNILVPRLKEYHCYE